MTPLIWKGLLVLSLGDSYQLENVAPTLWLSSPKFAEAQLTEKGVILKAKASGAFFISGLRKYVDPQKVLVASSENFKALKQCPLASVYLNEKNELTASPTSESELSQMSDCGFREIELKEGKDFSSLFLNAEKILLEKGYRIKRAQWIGGKRHLEISANPNDEKEIESALGKLKAFYQISCLEGAKPGRTLVFQLTLFEFSRAKAQALGIQVPTQLRFEALQGPPFKIGPGSTQQGLAFDFGMSSGVGKILAQPQIRTKPGEKANFQSGGEIPIPQRSLHSSSTTWKNYGLQIELEPEAGLNPGDTEISLRFKVELSEPDLGMSIGGIPGMLTRRLESRFDLRCNEETILTTLVQSRQGKNKEGLFALSDIPLLGLLFSAQKQSQQSSELWFALRPSWDEISHAESPWTKKNL